MEILDHTTSQQSSTPLSKRLCALFELSDWKESPQPAISRPRGKRSSVLASLTILIGHSVLTSETIEVIVTPYRRKLTFTSKFRGCVTHTRNVESLLLARILSTIPIPQDLEIVSASIFQMIPFSNIIPYTLNFRITSASSPLSTPPILSIKTKLIHGKRAVTSMTSGGIMERIPALPSPSG